MVPQPLVISSAVQNPRVEPVVEVEVAAPLVVLSGAALKGLRGRCVTS